ncbi:MAG: hypothetical protein MI922_06515 [Bacteroidales bacterium]|nr:hypothetical protein [Bacteroidales bacterium]
MSFNAVLEIDGVQRRVLNANYVIRQSMDVYQRPNAFPHGGYISLRMEVTGSEEDELWEWAISPTMMKNGRVRFFRRDGMSRFADLEFWDAYCIELTESYSAYGANSMCIQIILSAGVQRFRGIVFEKHWKVTDLSLVGTSGMTYLGNDMEEEEVNEVVQEEDTEPELLECYFTDKDGNRVETLYESTLILVIKSKNYAGKTVNINLDNPFFDFKYNGTELENDILENYTINKDMEKVELEVIEE